MGIGIALPADGGSGEPNLVEHLIAHARAAAEAGVDAVWFSQQLSADAVTLAALVAREVPGIAVGTSVVPIYPRHPVTLAAQAQTAQAASGGRFTLGVGLGTQHMVEGVFGVPYDRVIRHLRDHLTALASIFADGTAAVEGPTLTARVDAPWSARLPGAQPPVPVVVAAMGAQALRAAGELADGTIPFLAGPRTISDHIVPGITAAAAAAGRPAPRVIAALPGVVTADVEQVRAQAAAALDFYDTIPSYRAVLEREGAAHPADLAVIGDEEHLAAAVRRYLDAGATDIAVVGNGLGSDEDRLRTWTVLGELARTRTPA